MKNTSLITSHPLLSRLLLGGLGLAFWPSVSLAAPDQYFKITVNSNRDAIIADKFLTLREAISISNGQLKFDRLSAAEQQQVKMLTNGSGHRLDFQLPKGQKRIELSSELPAIIANKVTIDGGTGSSSAAIQNLTFATPQVEITPAAGQQINRGLAIMANDVTVTGLSIHGFRVGNQGATQNIPAADIFVGTSNYPQLDDRSAPQRVLIENNWLGITPNLDIPDQTSDFGVYVFNSQSTTVRHNAIAHHSASGIISQVNANNLLIADNAIFGNGFQGMPDAIRLEGNLRQNQIQGNLICGNDGSGIFIFKPAAGSVKITNNQLQSNGRRLRRAAIHLMGNDHQVTDNSIEFQNGSGVAVTAFAEGQESSSQRNLITNNRFQKIDGLSIDLITYRNDAVEDFQDGDGLNQQRNTENRRLDTGNGAINAPRFLASEFYLIGDRVNLDGMADPGAEVEIYQVKADGSNNGPLSKPLRKVVADSQGRFEATFQNLTPGTLLSAIATDKQYGSSEPAENAMVRMPGVTSVPQANYAVPADCALQEASSTVKLPVERPVLPPDEAPPPSIVTKMSIPRKVHFALDKSTISPASARVLQEIVKVLQDHPYISVDLSGHTDPRASQSYNQALSKRRVVAVRNYLLKQGIAPQRLTIHSLGLKKRFSNERGVQPYALDRRVEFDYQDLRGGQVKVIDRFDDLQLEK
jgi:outer membrane protein OmpA-like peptidoglycan-associated protein